jgi:hypothetical protein
VKVGDTVVLVEPFRKNPREVVISGETTKSFIVDCGNCDRKFNKKTGQELVTSWGEGHGKIVTKEQHEQDQWMKQNRPLITSAVSQCFDIAKLKKIQEILNQ